MGWCDEPDVVVCGGTATPTATTTEISTSNETTTEIATSNETQQRHHVEMVMILTLFCLWWMEFMDQYNCRSTGYCGESGAFQTCDDEFTSILKIIGVISWKCFVQGRPICDAVTTVVTNRNHSPSSSVERCDSSCAGKPATLRSAASLETLSMPRRHRHTVYPCPPGLVFVEHLNACDYPSNVACCGKLIKLTFNAFIKYQNNGEWQLLLFLNSPTIIFQSMLTHCN